MMTVVQSSLTQEKLFPPFSSERGLLSESHLAIPAAVRRENNLIRPMDQMPVFLTLELCTTKLDALHQHLWLAGLPVPARSLSRQRLMGRKILVTERPDEHLVWHDGQIFLKPLPDYLLCHAFWKQHLCESDPGAHASAAGLLLSYAWLIQHRSDFAIARELTLLPPGDFDFSAWTRFMADFLDHVDLQTMAQVDRRYKFGELRLSRLDSLTRLRDLLLRRASLSGAHMNFPKRYTTFFQTRFGWLLAAFAYMSVMLSTLQVGLGTTLEESFAFQRLSYVVTIWSLVVAFGSSLSIVFCWLVLFVLHVFSARSFSQRVKAERESRQYYVP